MQQATLQLVVWQDPLVKAGKIIISSAQTWVIEKEEWKLSKEQLFEFYFFALVIISFE